MGIKFDLLGLPGDVKNGSQAHTAAFRMLPSQMLNTKTVAFSLLHFDLGSPQTLMVFSTKTMNFNNYNLMAKHLIFKYLNKFIPRYDTVPS